MHSKCSWLWSPAWCTSPVTSISLHTHAPLLTSSPCLSPVPASQASLLCLRLPLQVVCTLPQTATCPPLTSLTALFKCVLHAPVCGGSLCPWQSWLSSCSLRSLSVSSSWNRCVLSCDILALSLLECQLHESEYFAPSTEHSTQHTVGVLSCPVMSSCL